MRRNSVGNSARSVSIHLDRNAVTLRKCVTRTRLRRVLGQTNKNRANRLVRTETASSRSSVTSPRYEQVGGDQIERLKRSSSFGFLTRTFEEILIEI